jgi:hypothetical protein
MRKEDKMKINSIYTELNGISLQGYLPGNTKYEDIISALGEPLTGDGYKVDAEWTIKFSDGLVATIYNYKTGKNYNGEDGLSVEDITDWHIGGSNKKVVDRVIELIRRN